MTRKHLAAVAALLMSIAGSSLAHGGSTISDKRYWPGETASAPDASSPLAAFDSMSPRSRAMGSAGFFVGAAASAPRYQGGPKSSY
jgi:hypothetical protein